MTLSDAFYKHFHSRDDWGKLGDNHPDVATLQKLAAESEGRKKIAVRQYSNCKFIREYEDKEQAALENDLYLNNLINALVGDTNTCGGYEWRYETDKRPLRQGKDRGEFVIALDNTFFTGKYNRINKIKQPIFSTIEQAQKYAKKGNVITTKNKLEKMSGKKLKVINLDEGDVNQNERD